MSFQSLINWFSTTLKQLFLIDAIGAAVTAYFIGIVLVKFDAYFGMPRQVLYVLATIALIFWVYSTCCYLFIKRNFKPFLKLIIFANLLYCCLTIALLFFYFKQLTILGFVYFIGEILVIVGLVLIEKRVCERLVD